MTKTLDGLISFLLDEIALCGPFGLDPCKFEDYVNRYYAPTKEGSESNIAGDEDSAPPQKPYKVDRQLHEQAWIWLTQQPEVRVGKNGEGNKLSLSHVQEVNKEYQQRKNATKSGAPTAPAVPSIPVEDASRSDQASAQGASPTSIEDIGPHGGALEETSTNPVPARPNRYRVYTSEARMWQAIAGHAPDTRRIPKMYFECLAIITSRKTRGILQLELTRVSGQDKKSVPKRTDVLAENGYIEKRAVVNRGSKTSMLFATRFAPQSRSIPQSSKSGGTSTAGGGQQGDDKILDYQPVFEKVLELLKESNIMALVDLRRKLVALKIPLSKGVWNYCIKQLGFVGLTQQIRARAHLDNGKQGRYFQCLKLLREPAEADWRLLFAGGPRSGEKNKNGPQAREDLSEDDQDAVNEDAEIDEPDLDNSQEDGRVVPRWVPERHLHNIIFDVIDAAGTEGISLKTLRHLTFGGGVVKPLERLMPRFVDSWQISQPLHLRHLAIIRDTKQNKRTGYFVHYSYGNFKKLVDRGVTSWEAVAVVEKRRKQKTPIPAPEAQPDLDEYGFPKIPWSQFLGDDNDATLEACIRAAPIQSSELNNMDVADLYQGDDADHSRPTYHQKLKQIKTSVVKERTKNQKRADKVALPPNFHNMDADEKKRIRNTQQTGIRFYNKKFLAEVAKMVESGENENRARNEVFARMDFEHQSRGLTPISEAMKAQLAGTYNAWRDRMEAEAMSKARLGQAAIIIALAPQPYQPSRHAHTQPLLIPVVTIFERAHDSSNNGLVEAGYDPRITSISEPNIQGLIPAQIAPKITKKRGRPKKSDQVARNAYKVLEPPPYLPSRYAHTQTYLGPTKLPARGKRNDPLITSISESNIQGLIPAQIAPKITKKRGRPKRSDQIARNTPDFLEPPPYLPSRHAHTQTYLGPTKSPARGKRKSQLPKHLEDSIVLSDNTSILPVVPVLAKRKRDPNDQKPSVKKARRTTTEAFYTTLANSIQRPSGAGVRVSEMEKDVSRRGKPRSMLAIFKSDQLKDFSKFGPGMVNKNQRQSLVQEQRTVQVIPVHQSSQQTSWSLEPAATMDEQIHQVQVSNNSPETRPTVPRYDEALLNNFSPGGTEGPTHDNRVQLRGPDFADANANVLAQDSIDKATESFHDVHPEVSRHSSNGHTGITQKSTARPEAFNAGGRDESTRTTEQAAPGSEIILSEPPNPPISGAGTDSPSFFPTFGPEESATESGNQVTQLQDPASSTAEARGDQPALRCSGSLLDAQHQANQSPRSSTPVGSAQGQESSEHRDFERTNDSGQERTTRIEGQDLTDRPHLFELDAENDAPKRTPTKPHKLNPPGGTMALRRKKIIMDMLEKCGGVLPFERSIEFHFQEQWHHRGGEGRPDIITIKAAIKQLVSAHQIRQFGFYFKGAQGKGIQKSLIMTNALDINHPKVRECQDQIIKCDPYAYTPPELKRPDSSRQAFIDSIQAQKSTAGDANETVQLQPKRLYQIRLELRKKAAEEKKQKKIDEANQEKRLRQEKAEEQRRLRQQKEEEEEAERQRQRREELQRLHAKLADLRAKSIDRLLTREEQHETMALHSAIMALNKPFAGLPPPPTLVEAPAYQEIRPLPVPKPGPGQRRNTLFPHLTPSVRRKVERLKGLNDPVPRTNLGDEARPSSVGTFSVFSLSKAVRRPRLLETEQRIFIDDERISDNDVEQSEDLEVAKKPPWRQLKLSTVNPDGSFEIQGLQGLLNTNEQNDTDRFRKDVDELLRWELRNPGHEYDVQDTPFVNHTFLHKHKVAIYEQLPNIRKALQVSPTGKAGRHRTRPFPQIYDDSASTTPSIQSRSASLEPTSSVQPTVHSLDQIGLFNAPVDKAPARVRFEPASALKRKFDSLDSTRKPLSGGKAKGKGKSRRTDHSLAPDLPVNGERPVKKAKIDMSEKLKSFSVGHERRLLVAVGVIRSIAGGLERNINWKLVTKVFEPDFDEDSIHHIWPTVRSKNKLLYSTMTADFQERFPKAYEEGLVPSIDSEHLEDYPWRKLVDWAMDKTDFPTQSSTIELPAERSSFDNLFSMRPTTDIAMAPLFNPDIINTVVKRQAILNNQAYSCPIAFPSQSVTTEDDSLGLAIAKTWIRATVVTPAANWDAEAVKTKLSVFRVPTIERAIRELQASKVLTDPSKKTRQAGRNYDLHESCISALDKSPSVATLRAASVFKKWLDAQFRTNDGSVDIKEVTKPEQALVLMSLFAANRIRLRPKTSPANKWGLLNGGYQTRLMDKELLRFEITISPTKDYEYGNPLLPTLAPPAPHLKPEAQQPARIPLWYDINGDVVTVLWEMCLAAVLSVLSVRPGIGVGEIERAVRPALATWEIEEIGGWGVEVGCLERVGDGWVVKEGWWGVLGGKEREKDEKEDVVTRQKDVRVGDRPAVEEQIGDAGNETPGNREDMGGNTHQNEAIAKAAEALIVDDAMDVDTPSLPTPPANEHETPTSHDNEADIEMTDA